MATALKSLSDYNADAVPDATGMSFGIVVSEYNPDITSALLDACVNTLEQHGVKEADIKVELVPGTFELPAGALMLYNSFTPNAVICLGCVIKGDTDHDKYINHAVAQGITNLSLKIEKPIIFGVLTPNTLQQAQDRAGGKHGNKGVEAAVAAIKMVALQKKLG